MNNLPDLTDKLQGKVKNKVEIRYTRGLIKGEDKVLVELCINETLIAQSTVDPQDAIDHLSQTIKTISL
jgi:hypothetical protein